MRKLFLFYSFLLLGFSSQSQVYGNEWINYSQKYFSVKIVNNGIHRINYDDLLSASIPVNLIAHENIQVFGREKEIPIWVETNG